MRSLRIGGDRGRRSPLTGFLSMYAAIAGIGFVVIEITNLLLGVSIQELLAGNVWIMLGQMSIFVVLFMAFTHWRLGRLAVAYRTGQPAFESLAPSDISRLGDQALKFPYHLFRAFMLLAVGLAVSYHILDWWTARGTPDAYTWDWGSFADFVSFEMGLALLLGLVMYSRGFRILRPVVGWLSESTRLGLGVRISIRNRIHLVTLSLVVMTCAQYINLVYSGARYGLPISLGMMVVFVVLAFLFVRNVLADTIHDIELVRNRLTDMNQHAFPNFTDRLPVESGDEVADLKIQFNELQQKAEHYYRQRESDLGLAGRVQQQLIATEPFRLGNLSIQGHLVSQQQVGGDFFDTVHLSDGQMAVLIGDVSGKGMSAALVMATFLGMFRSEVRYGGTPAQVLYRLGQSLTPVLMSGMYVTAGLLYIHPMTGVYRYASAGHLPPLHVNEEGIREWTVGSLPLGFQEDEPPEIVGTLQAGERVLLYTDGVIEDRSMQGTTAGFDRLMTWFHSWHPISRDGLQLMERLVESIASQRGTQEMEDDQTLVIVEFGKSSVSDFAYNGASQPGPQTTRSEKHTVKGGRSLPMTEHGLLFEASYESAAGCESAARADAEALMKQIQPAHEQAQDICTLLAEACRNAAEHGNRWDPTKRVSVTVSLESARLCMEVADEGGHSVWNGPPAERSGAASEPVRSMERLMDGRGPTRGWGLQLIEALSDDWSVDVDDSGTRMQMFVNLRREGDPLDA